MKALMLILAVMLLATGCFEDPDETGVCVFGSDVYECRRDGSSVHCDWDRSSEEEE